MTKSAKIEQIKTPALVGLGSTAKPKEEIDENKIPQPKGWRILIAIPDVEEVTEGGIIKADSTRQLEQVSTVLGLVLKMGDQCYNDTDRFGDTPWCQEGDFVLIGAYKGVRFKVKGEEFRIINDDTVQAVVDDPRGVSRI
mgnify:FL=1|jgi:co-chaperonin GroES (HSP10)